MQPRDPKTDPAILEAKNLIRRKRIQLEYMREYDDAVVEMVREAGFKTASTMDRGVNDRNTDPLRLKRWTARYRTRTLGSLFRKLFGSR